MKTWMNWIGEQHQKFHDWATKDDISTYKTVFRTILFYLVDGFLLASMVMGVMIMGLGLFGRFFIKDEPMFEEE